MRRILLEIVSCDILRSLDGPEQLAVDTGYRGGSPTTVFRLGDPALCGSHPLVTTY